MVAEAVSAGNADLMRGLTKQELVHKTDEELSGLRWPATRSYLYRSISYQ
ncbi:hypothetical protein SAMN05216299_11369 [Nitrosospira sp. Nsp14]|nr:hypothetical protein [Nitrosospira sp. Nsp14]SFH44604.1 hypothetical protein SAMN05216299_11369 [Nitrosospira sp. Nsp14]